METVFITGADKGLGIALVHQFLERNFRVFAGRYAAAGDLDLLATKFPGQLEVIPQDVADMDSVKRSAQAVALRTQSLDILINCAGVFFTQAMLPLPETDLTDGHLQAIMEVNAFGPLRVTQQFLPLLEKGARKCIVNISSEAGSIAGNGRTSSFGYCMSKTALNAQSQILQRYLQPQGFKVLAVHPGWLQTDMGGPEATVPADVSAAGIFALATKIWSPGEPLYMDYTGAPLRW